MQLQLAEKRKTFSGFFVPFLESISNFNHFEKKDHRHTECISEYTDCENLG